MKKTVTLCMFDVENKNGRIYEAAQFEKLLDKMNERANNGRFIGELGHPDGETFAEVSLTKASHRIDDVRIEGDLLVGDINTIDTKNGKFLAEHIDEFVFRPRSIGTVGEDKKVHLERVITFDAVPKDQDAF